MGSFLTYFVLPTKEEENPFPLNDESILLSPFGYNEKLNEISRNFQLTPIDLINFHKVFKEMDSEGTGYINLDSFYYYLSEELNSIISPYIERFFLLIDKENIDKISFVEWLPPIAVFCLYTNDKIIQFVFNLIDTDQDNFLAKKDIIKFLTIERFNKKIFPYNFIKAIELLEVPRSDKINFDQFKKIHHIVPFLCFPAFRLQKKLRKNILGEKFWDSLFNKISKVENEENKKKQLNKMQEDKQKKKTQTVEKYKEKFEKKMKDFKIDTNLRNSKKEIRIHRKRASDQFMDINLQNFMPLTIKKISSEVYIKKNFNEDKQKNNDNFKNIKDRVDFIKNMKSYDESNSNFLTDDENRSKKKTIHRKKTVFDKNKKNKISNFRNDFDEKSSPYKGSPFSIKNSNSKFQ